MIYFILKLSKNRRVKQLYSCFLKRQLQQKQMTVIGWLVGVLILEQQSVG